jgi:M6 family metalloprotease-like protein
MRKLLLALFAQMLCFGLFGVPANPTPFVHVQSDGSEITVRLRGDEFFRWLETVDGYTLQQKDNGDFVYAQLDLSEGLISSEILANDPENRTPAELDFLQSIGKQIFSKSENLRKGVERKNARASEVKSIRSETSKSAGNTGVRQQVVVLVEYADVEFRASYSVAAGSPEVVFGNLMNSPNYAVNGAVGSVKQYFFDNSNGKLTLESTVLAPVKLSQPRSYYSASDPRNREMIREALLLLADRKEDFARFTNGGNTVEHLHVIFAGSGQEQSNCTECIHSHNWTIASSPQNIGGVLFHKYSCSPELSQATSAPSHIGVICHEIGHTLGLCDMYDTRDDLAKGLGPWSLMDVGSWNNNGRTPPYLNGFERYQIGWFTPILISDSTYQEITLPPLGNSAVSYVFYAKDANGNPIPNERFYLENRNTRRNSGTWDAGIILSGTEVLGGLMVYHMDSTNSSPWILNQVNANPAHENFRIISARGNTTPNTGPGIPRWYYNQDPFPQGTLDSLTDNSTPNTKSWAGISSEIPIRNITRNATNNTITFTVGSNSEVPPFRKDTVYEDICEGETFAFRGKDYSTDGIFYDTVRTPVGQADTIYTLDLLLWETMRTDLPPQEICEGDSVFFKNMWLKTAGTYRDTLVQMFGLGCDSIVTLNLSVKPNTETSISETITQGDSLVLNGTVYKIAGTYHQKLENSAGCDSNITLVLTVVPPSSNMPFVSLENSEITLFPNPTSGKLYIQTTESIKRVEIYNIQGIAVKVVQNHVRELFVDDLETGVYFIRITTDKGVFTQRLVRIEN